MRRTLFSLLIVCALCQTLAPAQTKAPAPVLLIRAGRMIDTRAGRVLQDQGILVEGERIKATGPFNSINAPTLVSHQWDFAPSGRSHR